MKLYYNPAINDRKTIVKKWAELSVAPADYDRRKNIWAVGNVLFLTGGVIEGPLTCQQVNELSYLIRDWEFADRESRDEYEAQRLADDSEKADKVYAIPDDSVPTVDDGGQYEDYTHNCLIEHPADGFGTPETFGKLECLIQSQKTMIAKALGADNLDFHEALNSLGHQVIVFRWFYTEDVNLFSAATAMIHHLCRKVLELRKVDPTEHPVSDERFEFSRFLHWIGMVGAKHKKDRKALMQNLGGSTWRKAVEERKVRRELEEMAKGA
jgi:hypothetical protein